MPESTPTEPRKEMLDTDPAVSIDIALGRQAAEGSVLDVDMQAIRSVLEGLGAPEDNSDLSIRFSKEHPRVKGMFTYDGTVTMSQSVNDHQKMNKTFQHEVQHYIDFVDGVSPMHTRSGRAKIAAHNFGMKMMIPGTAVTTTSIPMEFFKPGSMLAEAAPAVCFTGIGISMLGLASAIAYKRSTIEIRAQIAEKRHIIDTAIIRERPLEA